MPAVPPVKLEVGKQKVRDERGGDGRDRQVQPLDAQRRMPTTMPAQHWPPRPGQQVDSSVGRSRLQNGHRAGPRPMKAAWPRLTSPV